MQLRPGQHKVYGRRPETKINFVRTRLMKYTTELKKASLEGTVACLRVHSSKVWPQNYRLASKAMTELWDLGLKLLFCTKKRLDNPFVDKFLDTTQQAKT